MEQKRTLIVLAIAIIIMGSSIQIFSEGILGSESKGEFSDEQSNANATYSCTEDGLNWFFELDSTGSATLIRVTGPDERYDELRIPKYVWNGNNTAKTFTVTEIGPDLMSEAKKSFLKYSPIERISLPNTIESIGNSAFYGLHSLKEVIFEDGSRLKKIDDRAFEDSYYDDSAYYDDVPSEIIQWKAEGQSDLGTIQTSECVWKVKVPVNGETENNYGYQIHVLDPDQEYSVIHKYDELFSLEILEETDSSALFQITFTFPRYGGSYWTSLSDANERYHDFLFTSNIAEVKIWNSKDGNGNLTGGSGVVSGYSPAIQCSVIVPGLHVQLKSAEINGPEGSSSTIVAQNKFFGEDTWIIVDLELQNANTNYTMVITVLNEIGIEVHFKVTVSYGAKSLGFDGLIDVYSGHDDHFSITLPDSVEYIGDNAFNGGSNGLNEIIISEYSALREIGDYALPYVKGTIFIPKGVISIGEMAIDSKTGVQVDKGNTHYTVYNGNLLDGDGSILHSYHGNEVNYSFDASIKEVSAFAFYGNESIKEITIRNGIEWGRYPFWNTKIKAVQFGEDVTDIPDRFLSGTMIESITIPKTIKSIGVLAFYNISTLATVDFESGSQIEEIGSYSFSSNSALTTVEFGSHTADYCNIGEGAFYNCDLLETVIFNGSFSLKSIGKGAFAKEQEQERVNDKDVFKQKCAVSFNSRCGIIMPASVETIGAGAFSIISGGNIHTYGGVVYEEMINENAIFGGILVATGFTISFEEGSEITSIEDQTFQGLDGATSIDLSNCAALQSIGKQSFALSSGKFEAWYDEREKRLGYKNLAQIVLSPNLVSIDDMAFYRYGTYSDDKLQEKLYVPSSVTDIGEGAFASVARTISFAEGSMITTVGNIADRSTDVAGNRILDLTNCKNLDSVELTRQTILPSGIYDIKSSLLEDGLPLIKNLDEVVFSKVDGRLEINSDDIVINRLLLDGDYTISCDGGNSTFGMCGGLLLLKGSGGDTVIGLDSAKHDYLIDADSGISKIADYAFRGSSIHSLRICTSVDIGDYILSDTRNDVHNVDVFLIEAPTSLSDASFGGSRNLSVFMGHDVGSETESLLSSSGTLYRDVAEGDSAVYLPTSVHDNPIGFGGCLVDGDYLIIDGIELGGGYSLYDVEIDSEGCTIVDHDTLRVVLDVSREIIIHITLKDRLQGPFVQVLFDGNGGSSQGSSWISVQVPVGMTVIDSDIPSFTRNGYDFAGWNDKDGDAWSGSDVPLEGDMYLEAVWKNRTPTVTMDSDAGYVLFESERVLGPIIVTSGAGIELEMVPYSGFQLKNWVIDGKETDMSASEPLVLESVDSDVTISVTFTYSSISSGLDSIVNVDLPTTEELSGLIRVSELGGHVNTSSMMWTGHSSVPLIVDNYVYFRAGNFLYKAESDTGYIVKGVESSSVSSFYHYLGYGDGLIIDYAGKTIYNLDLVKVCKISTTGTFEFHDGVFYSSGSVVDCFSSEDCYNSDSNENVKTKTIGTMNGAYSSYGMSGSVFVGDYMYRVYADKTERGIVGIDLTTGKTEYKKLDSLSSMFLDDGWLSYSDGTLYLTGYTQGLFGSIACEGYNKVAFVNVNGLEFGEEYYRILEGQKYFMSEFLVYENRGFVNSGGSLYVFEISGSGNVNGTRIITPLDVTVPTALSHGSIVMNTDEVVDGYLYFYLIPYQSEDVTMSVVRWSLEDDSGVGTYTSKLPQNYNSQAVRSDVDGRMIWYNDSGHIYTYTTPEKNVYYFLIQDGSSAKWYESNGATAADALAALGRNVVTLNPIDGLATVNGKVVSKEWSINVLTDTSDKTKAGIIGQYEWVKLDDLYSNAHDTDHYYIITDSSTLPTSSTTFTYAVEEGLKTYTFADNIGDRGIIGKELIHAEEENTVTIRFYDGERQYIDSVLIGKKGGKVTGSFPSVYKYGKVVEWKDSDGKPVLSFPSTFDINRHYYLNWADASATYEVGLNPDTEDKTRVTFNLEIMRNFGLEDLEDTSLFVIAYYDGSDGKRFISTISKIVIENGNAKSVVSLSSDDLVDVSFRIIQDPIAGTTFNNYGSANWSVAEGV